MRTLLILASFLLSASAIAAGGSSVPLDKANYDLTDKASLQRGAQMFNNYCLGCHQMQYQRYSRSFEDLGIPLELGQEYLQFTGVKVTDHIVSAMPVEQAASWFGAPPPDLTLTARVRGADWLYTYMRTFYVDESKPFGVNNKVFKDVGMPHVLQELQGVTTDASSDDEQQDPNQSPTELLKNDGSGELTSEEYDAAILDLVNYLVYVGEPFRLQAESIGRWVLAFIFVLFVFVYLLKKEYWRDLH